MSLGDVARHQRQQSPPELTTPGARATGTITNDDSATLIITTSTETKRTSP